MTIFILDDSHNFLNTLGPRLKSAGHHVYTFQFLSEALASIEKKPDIIIVNHIVNGLESLQSITLFKNRLTDCNIFYVSSIDKIEVLALAKQLGVQHFFYKDEFLIENIVKTIVEESSMNEKKGKKTRRFLKRKQKKHQSPNVFILDDDKLFSTFIRHKISKLTDLKITLFDHPDELYAAAADHPDLLFLDFHLPQTTGDLIFEKFKKLSPNTKVVMFTSQQDLKTAMQLFKAGIADYIVKNNDWERNLLIILEKQLNLTLS